VASPPSPPSGNGPQIDTAKIFAFGLQCYANGDLARAILAFRKVIAIAPNSSAHHAALGRALLRSEGLTPQAESAMRAAITLDPQSTDLLLEVGEVYLENSRPADAKILFTRASRLDPSNDEARLALGAVGGERQNLLGRLKRR
jgi:cytochrome c-type biogenesis protein CcmH/NrfG